MNQYALKAVMYEKGISEDDLRNTLGISRSAFYRKKNDITEFTRNEISTIIGALSLSPEQVMSIFFTKRVS